MPSVSFPVSVLTYDGSGVGAFTDIKIGQTVRIKSSGGAFKGWARVRDTPTSSTIPIGVISKGDIEIANNDRIEILNERRLWAKVPRIEPDGTLLKDWTLEFNAATAQPPVAVGGVSYIGEVDPDTGLITVTLPSSASYAIANGASISSRLWNVIDGTITVGTSTSTTITATFPAGYRYVELTVTDSNGNTHTTYILVVGIDPDTCPAYPVRVSRLGGSLSTGWEGSFSLIGESDFSDIPYGVPCMLWAKETYGTTEGSLNGQTGREHIKFVGWTSSELTHIEPLLSDFTLNAQNAQAILGALPAFSQTTERNASPTSWFQVANLNLWRHFHYLAHWHSTLFDVCPVELPSYYADYPTVRLDADAGSLLDQFNFVFGAVRAKFTSGMRNEVYARYNPHLMTSAERSALTTVVTLADTDWTNALDIEATYRPPVGMLRGSGIVASADTVTAVLSAAPGSTPGQGASQDSLDRQLVVDQSDLNSRVGREYARRNLANQVLPITILNGGVIADPSWQELIKFTTSVDNKRGISYTSDPFVLATVDVTYDHENAVSIENWQLEYMTAANVVAGITVQVPGADTPIDDEYIASDGTYAEQSLPPYEYTIPEPYIPNEVTDGEFTSDAFLAAFNAVLAIASSANTSDPDWAAIALTGDVTSVIKMDTTRLIAATDSNLYDITDVTTTPSADDVQAMTNIALLRKVAGVENAIGIYRTNVSAGGNTYTDNFASGLGIRSFFTSASFPFYKYAAGEGEWISSGGKDNNGGCVRTTDTGGTPDAATVFVDLGREYTITHVEMFMAANVENSSWGWLIQIWDGDKNLLDTLVTGFDNASTLTYVIRDWSGSESSVRYISYNVDMNASPGEFTKMDNISVEYDGASVEVKFSDSGGVVIDSTRVLGAYQTGEIGYDVDDFDLGIHIGAADRALYYTYDDYTDTFAGIAGLSVPNAGALIQFVRIPYLTIGGLENSTPTAFEFIYGVDSLISGASVWRVVMNMVTGVVTSETDITPTIASAVYVPVTARGNQLEVYGGNAATIAGWFVEDGDTVHILLGSGSGGGSWAIRQDGFNGEFVRFVEPTEGGNGLKLYVAGSDGTGYSSNFGGTIVSKDGSGADDFPTITGDPACFGVLPLD